MKVYFESLGCARNLVDSDMMMADLIDAGWALAGDPSDAAVIVINTCSFIEAAADESIDTILELARYKKKGKCRRLVVVGCLPERYKEEIAASLPEVDLFLGTGAFDKIVQAVNGSLSAAECKFPDPDRIKISSPSPQRRRFSHAAYVKIAEGCSRRCTYCIIPKLRGNQKSRPVGHIVTEVRDMFRAGVMEVTLVSQDSTFYGRDLKPPQGLDVLLRRLSDTAGDRWVRFLYGHPESIHPAAIDIVAARDNICSYFDIPIQHANERVLKNMGRHYSKKQLYELFNTIRDTIPDVALRTTVIVGFPGETDDDFQELCEFVETVAFDHLGVFTYSDAEDLPSHGLSKPVDPVIARKRHDRLMAMQMAISAKRQRRFIGSRLKVLVEEQREAHLFFGRSQFQAPEVDGIVYIQTDTERSPLAVGTFATVHITDSLEYDLIGVPE